MLVHQIQKSLVLLLTQENTSGEGSRLPGVFIKAGGELDIRFSVNGKWNYGTIVVGALKEGTWTKVEVQQMYTDNKVRTYESVLTTLMTLHSTSTKSV